MTWRTLYTLGFLAEISFTPLLYGIPPQSWGCLEKNFGKTPSVHYTKWRFSSSTSGSIFSQWERTNLFINYRFFFNLLNCSCKFPSRHLFSAWSFFREIFLSAFMISVVLTIQLQLRHIIILQGWWRFFKVDGAHEELRFYTVVVEAIFLVHL